MNKAYSMILIITTHLYPLFRHPGDHKLPQLYSAFILGTTTNHYLLFHHPGYHHRPYTPLPNSSIIMGIMTTNCLNFTLLLSWGPLQTTTYCAIILCIITVLIHLYLTVPSSWGSIPTSNSQFHYHGDHYVHEAG